MPAQTRTTEQLFKSAVATATVEMRKGDAACAVQAQLALVLTGFSGTVDIQGSYDDGTTWVNLPYGVQAAGAIVPTVAQLSYSTSTTTPVYIILVTAPRMRVVMTRSVGTLTSGWITGLSSAMQLLLAAS